MRQRRASGGGSVGVLSHGLAQGRGDFIDLLDNEQNRRPVSEAQLESAPDSAVVQRPAACQSPDIDAVMQRVRQDLARAKAGVESAGLEDEPMLGQEQRAAHSCALRDRSCSRVLPHDMFAGLHLRIGLDKSHGRCIGSAIPGLEWSGPRPWPLVLLCATRSRRVSDCGEVNDGGD